MNRREQYIQKAVETLHERRQGGISKGEFTKRANALAEQYSELFKVDNVAQVATDLIWEINLREQLIGKDGSDK